MILLLYSLFSIIIIFITLLLTPTLLNLSGINLPINLLTDLILTVIIGLLLFIFHLHNTSTTCENTYKFGAFLNSTIFSILLLVYCILIEYYPSILDPFIKLFTNNENPYILLISKTIMIYGAVFLILTFTSFQSIKETCRNDITKIKKEFNEIYSKL